MNKIKITDRESLTKATIQAHIDAPAGTGSWIAKIEKRAEIVSQPAWDEIVRLRTGTTFDDLTDADLKKNGGSCSKGFIEGWNALNAFLRQTLQPKE